MQSRRIVAGRLLGVGCGAWVSALTLAALLGLGMPHGRLQGASVYAVGALGLLAVAAAAAAWARRVGVLLVLALLSFVPVGLYLLGVPHWLKWVGAAHLGYFAAAALLWSGERIQRDGQR